MRSAVWALLGGLALIWGSSFLLNRLALEDFTPAGVVLGRVTLGALALLVMAGLAGAALPRSRRAWGDLAVMGVLNNLVPFGLIVWGQTRIGSGQASILNATTPLFGVLLAPLMLRNERLLPGRLVGVLLGLAGVAVMLGRQLQTGQGADVAGQLAVLAAAVSYALASLWSHRLRHLTPVAAATGQVVSSATILGTCLLLAGTPLLHGPPDARSLAAVAGLAIGCTAIAYLLYFKVAALGGVTDVLLVTFLIPPVAVGLGVLLLGERLALAELGGAGLVGLGLVAIDGRPWRWLRGRKGVPAAR